MRRSWCSTSTVRCTHWKTAAATKTTNSPGTFDAAAGTIECLLHSARFDIRDGRPLCAPAYSAVPKFPVKQEHGGIWTRDDR